MVELTGFHEVRFDQFIGMTGHTVCVRGRWPYKLMTLSALAGNLVGTRERFWDVAIFLPHRVEGRGLGSLHCRVLQLLLLLRLAPCQSELGCGFDCLLLL